MKKFACYLLAGLMLVQPCDAMSVLAAASGETAVSEKAAAEEKMQTVSENDIAAVSAGDSVSSGDNQIYLTELYPDDVNRSAEYGCGKSEIFEFIEVYNTGQEEVDFNEKLTLYYEYGGDGSKDKELTVTDFNGGQVIIPAQGCAVFWGYREDVTYDKTPSIEDFRNALKIPDTVPVYRVAGQNGLNATDRGLSIRTEDGRVVSRYFYGSEDVADGKSVELAIPDSGAQMEAYARQTTPNPGIIHNRQLGKYAKEEKLPEFFCESPVTRINQGEGLETVWSCTGEPDSVTLFYRTPGMEQAASETITPDSSGQYKVSIDADAIGYSRWVEYYLEAEHAAGKAQTERIRVWVTRLYGPAPGESTRADELTITEIYPNDISRDKVYGSGSNDLMEYLEITNPTSRDISFSEGYELKYCYPSGSTIKEKTLTLRSADDNSTEIVIPANGSAVLWCDREAYTTLYTVFPTVEEFRAAYQIPDSVPVYKMTGQNGIGNTDRGFNLYFDGESISRFYWTASDVADGKSVHLRASAVSNEMIVYGRKQAASAGWANEEQLTYVTDYRNYPVITLADENSTAVKEGEIIRIPYTYEDQTGMQGIDLYYRTAEDSEYQVIETNSFAILGKYYAMIPSDATVGTDYVDYYLVARNPYRSTTTEVRRIQVERRNAAAGIRVNIQDGQILSGSRDFVARDFGSQAAPVMSVDGNVLETVPAIEQEIYFTFSYSGVDSYFKNALTAGDKVIKTFSKCSEIPTDSSMAIPVSRTLFTYREDGTAEVTLQLRAGTWGSPFESGTDANQDDFTVWNLYMKLSDGTLVSPTNIANPQAVVKMGDSAGCTEVLELTYVIPAQEINAVCAAVDTAALSDGSHTLRAEGSEEKTISFVTDNTAPVISLNLEEGEQIEGIYSIDVQTQDITAVTVSAQLDGRELTDYTIHTSAFQPGEHTLVVTAADEAGNESSKQISFLMKDADTSLNGIHVLETDENSATLEVPVEEGIVALYAGRKLAEGNGITVLEGTGDNTSDAVRKESGSTTISPEGNYPYQILEIEADGAPEDIVRLSMDAQISYQAPIQLYVQSFADNSWEKLEVMRRGDTISAEFALEGHTQGGIARVLVQGRGEGQKPSVGSLGKSAVTASTAAEWDGTGIPEEYDFSFAWITDTQYYCETWNDNFYNMNQWIIDQAEAQKIKYVIHTGDIVDEFNEEYQFIMADSAMKMLDEASIPYGVLGGNHDVAHGNQRYDLYWKYFGEDRFADSPVYGGSYRNNLGHYDLLNVDGEEMIFLYMSWDIYEEEVAWMNDVLALYPGRKAVICVHGGIDASGAESYTSKLLLNEVCEVNPNVFAILNGHYHGASINIEGFDDDGDGTAERKVYQICTDYQSAPEGGQGYVKMLYFDLKNDKIYINSYSSKMDDFNYFDAAKPESFDIGMVQKDLDIYELDVDFGREARSLTVDNITGGIYGQQIITSAQAQAGSARLRMENLTEGQTYRIYATKENENGVASYTEILEFVFENQQITPGGGDDSGNTGDNGGSTGENGGNGGNVGDNGSNGGNAGENGGNAGGNGGNGSNGGNAGDNGGNGGNVGGNGGNGGNAGDNGSNGENAGENGGNAGENGGNAEDNGSNGENAGENGGNAGDNGTNDAGDNAVTADWNLVGIQLQEALNALGQTGTVNNQRGTAGVWQDTSSNRVLNIVSGSNTVVPITLLRQIQGRSITLAFHNGRGVAFSIAGQDIAGVDLSSSRNLDLSSVMDTTAIPASLTAQRTAEAVTSRSISLRGRDLLGLHINMHLALGAENAGKYANLFRYNSQNGRLEYSGSYVITEKGYAMFALAGASDYLVTVTDSRPKEKIVNRIR